MGESLAWRVKTYLQWTGWLQYIPNLVVAATVLTIALLLQWLGSSQLLYAFGIFLLGVLVFDLVTVKLGLHPSEKIPNRPLAAMGLGFRVQGIGFRVQGLGLGVLNCARKPYLKP
ncbi:unnamed protein product [Symbiodinium sp. CCMP2456]|nr:unnamed protein product [Symbiodinium sp. CCMP2456]